MHGTDGEACHGHGRGHARSAAGGPWLQLALIGLIACACLAVGEAAPALFPVHVTLVAQGDTITLTVDGEQHTVPSQLGGGWTSLALEQPGPAERLYQIDGSDTTSMDDRNVAEVQSWETSPLYQADAWLEDEGSFSRWENVQLFDAAGNSLATGLMAAEATPLPASFRVEAALRHPEAVAVLWLLKGGDAWEGLELNADMRVARWDVHADRQDSSPESWFFPEQPLPFLADLLQLGGRSVMAGFALVLAACGCGWLLVRAPPRLRLRVRLRLHTCRWTRPWASRVYLLVLPLWLGAASAVTIVLYQEMPHVLDAVSYYFQAGVFASGHVWLTPPDLVDAFNVPFGLVRGGQWYSQYPPGAPAAYALGRLLSVAWLVGPLAGVVLLVATAWTGSRLFGRWVGLAVLLLGALSPFALFQAGSFLSHPIAAACLAVGLAAVVAGTTGRRRRGRWFVVAGAALGYAFTTRETAAVLFALPVLGWLAVARRWSALALLLIAGLPFVAGYLWYDAVLTGNPFLLPRLLLTSNDTLGFGNGLGFYGRHTVAAGLANAYEDLTLLQFDLFGWPPLFALGLLALPLLAGRPRPLDVLLGIGAALFVVTYVAYYYSGIVLGARYYFEALPWFLLLAGRGLQRVAHLVRRFGRSPGVVRAAVAVPVVVLCLNTVLFYLPHAWTRRADFTGITGRPSLALPFVQKTALGPRLVGLQEPALVLVGDERVFADGLAALNCGDLGAQAIQQCPVLFALATKPDDEQRVIGQYGAGRHVYEAVLGSTSVTLRSVAASSASAGS